MIELIYYLVVTLLDYLHEFLDVFFKPSKGRGSRVGAPTTSGTPVTISAPVTVNTPTTIVASGRGRVENSRAVPWRYDNAYRSDRRAVNQTRPAVQAPVTISAPVRTPVVTSQVVDNVGGPGGFTRSGRLFAPQQLVVCYKPNFVFPCGVVILSFPTQRVVGFLPSIRWL